MMTNMGEHSRYQTECLQKFPWQIKKIDNLMSFNNECRPSTHLIQRYLSTFYILNLDSAHGPSPAAASTKDFAKLKFSPVRLNLMRTFS